MTTGRRNPFRTCDHRVLTIDGTSLQSQLARSRVAIIRDPQSATENPVDSLLLPGFGYWLARKIEREQSALLASLSPPSPDDSKL